MSKVLTIMLAGGAGERLYPLTKDCAKPAVPFAGAYRIIDITLSNCINSGQCCPGKVTPTDGKSLPLNVLWSVLPGNDLKSRGRKWPPERSIPTRHNGG